MSALEQKGEWVVFTLSSRDERGRVYDTPNLCRSVDVKRGPVMCLLSCFFLLCLAKQLLKELNALMSCFFKSPEKQKFLSFIFLRYSSVVRPSPALLIMLARGFLGPPH